jgi:hypothetical protein
MAHPTPENAIGHWSRLFEGLQAAPMEFYQQVELAVRNREIPETVAELIEYREGGAFSRVRVYMRIRRRREVFDVCGAPFGNGFFVSWWFAILRPKLPSWATVLIILGYLGTLGWFISHVGIFRGPVALVLLVPLVLFFVSRMGKPEADDFILQLPLLGPLYERFFEPITYYRIDTSEMFQQSVRNAVDGVVNQITTAAGIRPLTELERKPVMRDFFKK